jgi:hypothetical protein
MTFYLNGIRNKIYQCNYISENKKIEQVDKSKTQDEVSRKIFHKPE